MKVTNITISVNEETANALGHYSQEAFPQVPFDDPNSVATLVLVTWFAEWQHTPAWRRALGHAEQRQVAKKPEQG